MKNVEAILGRFIAVGFILLCRAFFVMFVAAVVAKRTTVFAPIGYWESVAWAAGYGLVRGLLHKDEDT